MRIILMLIFPLLLIWAIWASFSTGGLYKLKQFNPEYPHPNKSAAFLISKLNSSEPNDFWSSYHIEKCSPFMPDWSKAERCFKIRILCESEAPQVQAFYGSGLQGDVFSEQYHSCWSENRPALGPLEWLRASRILLRVGVVSGSMYLLGGWNKKGEDSVRWQEENKSWLEPLGEWVKKGE